MTKTLTKAIVLLTLAAGLAGCAKSETVRPDEPADKTRSFDSELITPRMKIYGTGINFRGVVNPEQAWQSAGNPPHYLILDGSGAYDRIAFSGMDNVYRLIVHIKQGGEWTLRYPVPVEENSAVLELESVSGDKLKLEFIGTNIAVENVSLYGVYDGKPDYTVAKSYDLSEKERELIRRSENAFVSKNYGEAIEASREMIKLNPENPFPYMNLGQIYQGMAEGSEEHGEFLEIMERSMENYEAANMPENPSRLTLLDRTAKIYTYNLLDQEKAGEAWEEYVMVMEASGEYSKDRLARVLASRLASSNPSYEEQEIVMKKVVDYVKEGEVKGESFDIWLEMGRYISWILLKRNKDYEKAVETAELMVKNFPSQEAKERPWGHELLAVSLMALSRWEEAIDAWKGYFSYRPNETGIFNISFCYLKLENIENAYKNYALFKLMESNAKIYTKLQIEIEPYFNQVREKHKTVDERGRFISGSNVYQAYMEAIDKTWNIIKNELADKKEFSKEINKKVIDYLNSYNVEVK